MLAHVAELPIDLVVATGAFATAANALSLPYATLVDDDPEAAYERLVDRMRHALLEHGGATVLLKASRGVRLERLVSRFEEDFGHATDSDRPTAGAANGAETGSSRNGGGEG